MTQPNNTSDYQGTSSHVEETKELPTAAEIDKLDYVDSQECQRLRRTMVDDGVPVKRIHSPADLQSFMDSSALDRILQVLLNICNRIARFGIFQTDAQVHYLRNSLHQTFALSSIQSPPVNALINILQRLDQWISDIPIDPTPQRFGNKAFKIWGQRLESVASLPILSPPYLNQHVHLLTCLFVSFFGKEAQTLHSHLVTHHYKPIEAELLHHFKTSFGSFGRLDYGTGHEVSPPLIPYKKEKKSSKINVERKEQLSFLAYLSILHLTRILTTKDLLLTGLVVYQKYFNLCRRLHRVYNLEPAGSKGVYGLDDYFHVVYIFGSAQLLIKMPDHPTIKPSWIIDEKFVTKINDLKQSGEWSSGQELSASSVDFLEQEGLSRSLFFETILNTITLKSQPSGGTKQSGEDRSFLDHSPILINLATHVKGWPKIYSGLIKMMKGEILSKLPVMQHFWIAGESAVLPWKKLPPAPVTLHQPAVDQPDPDYLQHYRHLFQ
ncbi:hypothetical protein VP01_470g7 [Puccinia sorghi]|uniref:Serine/threonine-protein phosphatase 2A activator n=1 Tax=Puccinia sorghi TaxID=27349 RepID=A0A0L6UNU3_9BASI|nr:hypothetical protein VP01_470g7 [Puccinia sorghi]